MTWLDNASSADMIAAIREHSGAGPAKLSAVMGVSERTIYRITAGDVEPHGSVLVLLGPIRELPTVREALGLQPTSKPPHVITEPPDLSARCGVSGWDRAEIRGALQRAGMSHASARMIADD